MKALSGEFKKNAELLPTLPVGPDGKTPDPKAALTPSVQEGCHGLPSGWGPLSLPEPLPVVS